MSTATGDYALDFSGLSNQNPFSNANFTNIQNTMQVFSGLLSHIAYASATIAFTGGTYDGGNVVAKAEVHDCGGGDDWVRIGVVDGNNTGYWLEMNGTAAYISYYANGAYDSVVGTATMPTFVADSNFEIEVTKGSPNAIAVRRNGSNVTFTASTHTATLGAMRAEWGIIPNNAGACTFKSIAVDGLVTASATSDPAPNKFRRLFKQLFAFRR